MTRRIHKLAVAVLALSLSLSAPSAYAASRDSGFDPGSVLRRWVRVVKDVAKKFVPARNDDPIDFPTPPRP